MSQKKTNPSSPSLYRFYTQNDRERKNSAFAEKLINTRIGNLRESLSDFSGADHKLEQVKILSNIALINDARAINPNAVWFSLCSMKKPTIWIMSISEVAAIDEDLLQEIKRIVKTVITCSVYNSEIHQFFTNMELPVFSVMNIEEATNIAFNLAIAGDIILFSPGASMLSPLETYRDVGNKFKEAIAQL